MKKRYSSMENMKIRWFFFIIVALGNICANAIAQTASTTTPPACDITLDPTYAALFTYAGTRGLQFSSSVEGNCNDPCYTWDIIQDGSAGSTVNHQGKYYPGNSEGTDIVRVTDPCNEDISGIAVVNYISYPSYEVPECHLIIYPGNDFIHIGETLQLSVFPAGCSNSCPSWEITEAGSNGSTIDANGLYTAGSTPGTDVINATDACNESIPASITVAVGSAPTSPHEFNRMWPTLSQPWYFSQPIRIKVDDSGYVYVAQNYPPCIHKFTSDGQFVNKWGKEGVGEGEINSPFDAMAIDKNGFIYLEDGVYEQKRIQKFTPDGQFVSAWGKFGPGDEEIYDPDDMIIDEKGFFYIAESFSGIKKFTSEGQFVTKWGSTCDRYDGSGCEDPDGDGPLDLGDGQFDRITGIALDRDGFVYTLESPQNFSPRIQKFTSDGQFIEKWEIDTSEVTYFDSAYDIAIDRNGFMYFGFFEATTGGILKFSPDGQFVDKWGGYGSGYEEFIDAWGIAVDMNGFVYVCEYIRNSIQKLTSDGQLVDTWKSWGTGDGEFFRPFDIEVDTNGFVYVHELYSSRIQKFTPEGQYVETLPSYGQLKEIDSNNFFYYMDNTVDEGLIRKVSSDGEIVAQWNRTGSGYMVLLGPCDVTVDMNGFVYVADQGYYDSVWNVWAYPTHHILKFTPDGQFVEKWGKHGDGEDELSSVNAIAVDMNGFVYVCTGDTPWDGQIKKFTAEGHFVATWNAYCWDITVDTNGFVYCADTESYLQYTGPNQRMLQFTSDGQFVDTWGSIGSDPGQVLGIGSIEVGPNNEIYITDVNNHRIQVFEETSPIPSISVTPRAIMQSRWIPLPLFMSIRGTNTHFSGASEIAFSPASVITFPLVVINEQTLLCTGLLMPAWLTGPLSEELEVTVTTGLENVTGSIELHMMPFMLREDN